MKKFKTFKEFIKEGTWALDSVHAIDGFIAELKSIDKPSKINDALYKKYWNLVGDDELYDALDQAKKSDKTIFSKHVEDAIQRLEKLKQTLVDRY
jgi:hypothetical protein